MKRIRRAKPGLTQSDGWLLFHDNAPSHNEAIDRAFLEKESVTALHHPPYSPDMVPADYIIFPKLKLHMKGCPFDIVEDIQTNLTHELQRYALADFHDGIR